MTLKKYLLIEGRGATTRLAKEAGCDGSYIPAVINGRITPSFVMAAALSAATGGVVSIREIVCPGELPPGAKWG